MRFNVFLKSFILAGAFFIIGFCFIAKDVNAQSLSFIISTNTLNSDQELQVNASASGFQDNEIIYIKAAFYKDGSTNYFGKTKTDGGWVKNSVPIIAQRKVVIGAWDQTLIAASDPDDTGFIDSGEYKLKIGYYQLDSNGDPKSVKWSQTIADIFLKRPDPTVTPSHTPTKIPTPSSTPSPNPTATSKPANTNTSSPNPTKKPSSTIKNDLEDDSEFINNEKTGEVLGSENASKSSTLTEQPKVDVKNKIPKNLIISLSFVSAGSAMLAIYTLIPKIIKKVKDQKKR